MNAGSREIDRAVKESVRTAVSIYDVLDETLESLEPTHILTQVQCDVCAVSLRDVELAIARGMKCNPRIVSLQPDSLEQIWEDVRRVARSLDIPQRGEEVVRRLQRRMMESIPPAGGPQPRVACIEWIEPLMAAGNWMPELIELAGGINLFGEAGRHSPWMTWDELKAAGADVAIVSEAGRRRDRGGRDVRGPVLLGRRRFRKCGGRA